MAVRKKAERKRGRPKYAPTPQDRQRVKSLAAAGMAQDKIALSLGISKNTLTANFREELDLGLAEANAAVASALFKNATGGNVTAQIFWLKTRAGWTEKQEVNEISHVFPEAIPIKVIAGVELDKV